jgi:protein-S-isoprenylcysteine O-methyltransferase Ste14
LRVNKIALRAKAVLLFIASLFFVGAMLFLPAGTLGYWQAWLYMAVVFVPVIFVGLYLLEHDPELLERRFKSKEKEAKQRTIIKISLILFLVGFLIPGLDWRFGWSNVPFEAVIAANLLVLIGYAITFLAFRENSYAARTVEVEKGQKVVTTGPYAVVRHPMYVGVLLMYNATPIALGSYWALPLFLLTIPVIVYRILNEEDVLRRKLPGYTAYCRKTRYRLLPYVW